MKIPILMYHMIGETNENKEKRYCCDPKNFNRQMAYLKMNGYDVIQLGVFLKAISNGMDLPKNTLVITFDDGYVDNYYNAFPILKRYGFPATIFVVAELVGRNNEWMEKEGFPKRNLADWEALKEMSKNGITIGSHGKTHASLVDIDYGSALDEITNSRKKLEENLEKPIHFFAYPYGHFDEKIEEMVIDAGYHGACSTRSGFNSEDTDCYALRRVEVYGTDNLFHFILKLKFGTNDASICLPLKYYASRLMERMNKIFLKP